ncbi:hypothetical protein KAW43_00170 [Candidatus Parcubacteria bacterium]|nr:hypothetical protein [Candidatus Parcubacteria bacterium]
MLARGRKNEKKGGHGIEMYEKHEDSDRRDISSEEQSKDAIANMKASAKTIWRVCFGKVKGKTRR